MAPHAGHDDAYIAHARGGRRDGADHRPDRACYGALFDPDEGNLDPNGATRAYAVAARKRGADVDRAQPGARRSNALPTGEWRVETEQGRDRLPSTS